MIKKFEIQNLKCGGCQQTIIDKLQSIEGVIAVSVDVGDSMVELKITKETIFEEVKNKLAQIGYPIVGEDNSIIQKATSYVSCAVGRMKS